MTTSTKRPGELKPCPFCGGPADFIGEPHGYSVRCLHCLATSGPGDYGYQVTTKWNTRTPANESPAPQAKTKESET